MLKDLLKAAYLMGFEASGEGNNYEYPYCHEGNWDLENSTDESAEQWRASRDTALATYELLQDSHSALWKDAYERLIAELAGCPINFDVTKLRKGDKVLVVHDVFEDGLTSDGKVSLFATGGYLNPDRVIGHYRPLILYGEQNVSSL